MLRRKILLAAAGLSLIAAAASAVAQAPPAGASKNPTAAAAGTYRLDTRHASVIARLSHGGGYSLSTFRFGDVKGSLTWDPATLANSKVTVTVAPASIMTPVEGFGAELGGDKYLNSPKWPEATFVSTAVKATGPTTGTITGNLTLMGVTKPITVNAELVGAGKNARGQNLVGFTGTAKFKRSDFGFTANMGPIGDEVELLLDIEFNQPPA